MKTMFVIPDALARAARIAIVHAAERTTGRLFQLQHE